MCDVGYLCANFSLHGPLCARLRPDVRDRQTDIRQHHRLMPRLLGAGIINTQGICVVSPPQKKKTAKVTKQATVPR